jgi:hypothetical protein
VLVIDLRSNLPEQILRKAIAAAVIGVHVGMDLENEPAEGGFLRAHQAFSPWCSGGWGLCARSNRAVLDAEVVEGRSEKDGGQVALEVGFGVKVS